MIASSQASSFLSSIPIDANHYTDSVYLRPIDSDMLFRDFPWLKDLLISKIAVYEQLPEDYNSSGKYIELKMTYFKKLKRYIIKIKLGVHGPRSHHQYYSPLEHGKYSFFELNDNIVLFSNAYANTTFNFKNYDTTGDSLRVVIEPPMIDDRWQWCYSYDEGDDRPYLMSSFMD